MKTKFKYVNKTTGEMQGTPLACDRSTATIYINPPLYSKLTLFERKFWIWHEKGHIILDTSDEFRADEFAFNKMAGTEWQSLKQMLGAMEKIFDKNNPYHRDRLEHLYKLALEWDKQHPLDYASRKDWEGINNTLTTSGQNMIAALSVMSNSYQKKDNTMTIALLAVGAVIIFSTFLKSK